MSDEPRCRLRFKRINRILTGREFETIRRNGKRRVRGCLIANWLLLPEDSPSQLGIITTRRIGNAVVRNRARRLLRETFRLNQNELKRPIAVVLIARASIVRNNRNDVDRDFVSIMRWANLVSPEQ